MSSKKTSKIILSLRFLTQNNKEQGSNVYSSEMRDNFSSRVLFKLPTRELKHPKIIILFLIESSCLPVIQLGLLLGTQLSFKYRSFPLVLGNKFNFRETYISAAMSYEEISRELFLVYSLPNSIILTKFVNYNVFPKGKG